MLSSRQDASGGGGMSSSTKVIIGLASFVTIFTLLSLLYIALARIRHGHPDPNFLPTQNLRDRWRAWTPRRRTKGSTMRAPDDSIPTLYLTRSVRDSSHLSHIDLYERSSPRDSTLDRHTSIRSVATLPAYSPYVREDEQVLGREGERGGGIDVVLENPETEEEVEARREEEMSSLFSIRQQRRRELADREDRDRRRRAARDAGDVHAYQAVREESILSALERQTRGAAAMIVDHQSRSRERRVSSVSYGDLGVARHDGSRIRADSAGSDRQPLLNSAGSIAGVSILRPVHSRGRSGSSIMTRDSSVASELDMPPFGRAGSDFEVVTMNQIRHSRNGSRAMTPAGHRSRASSRTHRLSIDTSAEPADPIPEPPAYAGAGFEEAPPYVSPDSERARGQLPQIQTQSSTGAPLLPEIGRLPSIRIAEATPIEPRPSRSLPA